MASASPAKSRKPSSNIPPRKRRKRTVVTGAADDCFTCSRQGAQCDRRRPFCSQCLDSGLECAGYKTTLTWGVGVASRGKLRGLSLPITGSQPAEVSPQPCHPTHLPNDPFLSEPTNPTASPTSLYSSLASCAVPPLPNRQEWASLVPTPLTRFPKPPPPDAPAPQLFHEPPSSHSADSYLPSTEPPPYMEKLPTTPPPLNAQILSLGYTGVAAASETISEERRHLTSATLSVAEWPWNLPVLHDSEIEDVLENDDDSETTSWVNSYIPTFSQQLVARSVGKTPRLRYLISYYAEVIAPMIVAFDSPANPFRTCVLQLAQSSESLQEAIAALSTSNIRQRRERKMTSTERTIPARMSSLAHRALTDSAFQHTALSPEDLAHHERYHRWKAVNALNIELGDPNRRLSDSVLATLLILCLFHGCDTGIAPFRTQFAGVTKLLAIRMRSSTHMSDELKWFIRMFTWYDTMTATTNDREMQLRGICLQIASVTDSDWGLENMAGCDPVLFKYLTQLGRLNALSQSKDSDTQPLLDISVSSATVPPGIAYTQPLDGLLGCVGAPGPLAFPPPLPSRTGLGDVCSLRLEFWAEWHSLRQKLESWRLSTQNRSRMCTSGTYFHTAPTPPISPPSPSVVSPQNMQDVYHISESFRHAALLYTERLAYPKLPSNHPRIQHLVHCTMQHISLAQSDVYLLWPLFIAGSECVHPSHRTTIQQRCRDISKDSGFLNNLVCLELLEKIWAEDAIVNGPQERYPRDPSDTKSWNTSAENFNPANPYLRDDFLRTHSLPPNGFPAIPTASCQPTRHGLRWHGAMQARRGEGEYMVV
ncbi:hypothetical protein FE257_011635 [Aspergillus nanangensis]|uniref:Zn(2)-C6 fungal-type domain-containing protein n=1 Tax=Aspergillus nanangensis TaxID=2582783 RepID=A0AAD4CVH8_ASPNN|nr:hypothetical protein FE257_011635 [Aspergillus nanangensis]